MHHGARPHLRGLRCVCAGPHASDTILDVGVSDVVNDGANVLERKYPYPAQASRRRAWARRDDFRRGLPLGELRADRGQQAAAVRRQGLRRSRRRTRCSNTWAARGTRSALRRRARCGSRSRVFISGAASVSSRSSITRRSRSCTSGTRAFAVACRRLGKSEWADRHNLILMSQDRLRGLVPPDTKVAVGRTGIPLGPFSSNLYLFADTRDQNR